MSRTKQFDREEALEYVMQQFWLQGFNAVSVKAISEALGITRSSFYNAFISREALFLEALERYFRHSPHFKLAKFMEADSPLLLLSEVFKDTCTIRAQDSFHRGCLAVNSVSELVHINDSLGPIIEGAVVSSISCFEGLLCHAIQCKELDKDTDTKTLALILQNTLMGLNTLSKVVTSEQELWLAVKTNLQLLKVYKE